MRERYQGRVATANDAEHGHIADAWVESAREACGHIVFLRQCQKCRDRRKNYKHKKMRTTAAETITEWQRGEQKREGCHLARISQ